MSDKEIKVGDLVRVWEPKYGDRKTCNADWVDEFDFIVGKVFSVTYINEYGTISLNYDKYWSWSWDFSPLWLTKVNCHLDIEWE